MKYSMYSHDPRSAMRVRRDSITTIKKRFAQADFKRTSSECDRMKKNGGDASENHAGSRVTESGNSDEQFFDEPAVATGTREIVCGNLTPPTT